MNMYLSRKIKNLMLGKDQLYDDFKECIKALVYEIDDLRKELEKKTVYSENLTDTVITRKLQEKFNDLEKELIDKVISFTDARVKYLSKESFMGIKHPCKKANK